MIVVVGQDGRELALDLDVVTRVTVSTGATPTKHATENGTQITDHLVVKPVALSVVGGVSQTPVKVPVFGLNGASPGVGYGGALVFDTAFDRIQAVRDELVRIVQASELVGIATPNGVFDNVALTNVRVDSETSKSAVVQLDGEVVETANVELVEPLPLSPSGARKAKLGRQNPEEPEKGTTDEETTSTLRSFF